MVKPWEEWEPRTLRRDWNPEREDGLPNGGGVTRLRHRSEKLSQAYPIMIATDPGCDGRIRQVYVRLSNPQRWERVGWVCDRCGVSDLRLGRIRGRESVVE